MGLRFEEFWPWLGGFGIWWKFWEWSLEGGLGGLVLVEKDLGFEDLGLIETYPR